MSLILVPDDLLSLGTCLDATDRYRFTRLRAVEAAILRDVDAPPKPRESM